MCPNECSIGSAQPNWAGQVVELDEVRNRRRLDRLTGTRRVLAEIAAQQRSHDLDEALETYHLQLEVEDTIRSEFPQAYEDKFSAWVEADIRAEHPAGQLTADCAICRAIAIASGINLQPPEAA